MPISKKTLFKKVALTTGDPLGVGFEVTVKALVELAKKRPSSALFFLFRDHKQQKRQPALFKKLDAHYARITFFDLALALQFASTLTKFDMVRNKILIDLCLRTSAADWIFDVTRACSAGSLDSVVTAPLSKTLIRRSGYKQIGHTGIFRTFFPTTPLHMGFVGKDFNVLLATDHIPLSTVSKSLTRRKFLEALNSASLLRKALGSPKPIAVLGLNPHSGEKGLIGRDETALFKNLPKNFEGPLVPDAAFLKKNWSRYSLYVCLYHDQGLIPFKMHHGQDSGVHVTLGLPFIRTSVDHGTAFDIYNKNLANPASMLESIELNLKFLRSTYV